MGQIQILRRPCHANQADGMASHYPFSPPPSLSPCTPFPVPVLKQGELSLFGWRGGERKLGGIIG